MRVRDYKTPVSVTVEETPFNHRSWVKLSTSGEGETGLESGVTLGLEFTSTNPEVVAVIAAFLNTNLANLVVTHTTGTIDQLFGDECAWCGDPLPGGGKESSTGICDLCIAKQNGEIEGPATLSEDDIVS